MDWNKIIRLISDESRNLRPILGRGILFEFLIYIYATLSGSH